jgi:hypothetical protein
LELQIEGKGIDKSTERISIPVDNESNIVTHSTVLTASDVNAAPSETATLKEELPVAGPEMTVETKSYNVSTNESIPIRLDLERNTNLKVESMLNGEILKTEDFKIDRRRFVYMLTPEPGTNVLRFTLTNAGGNSTTEEVTVVYTPSEGEMVQVPAQQVIADSNRYLGLEDMAGGNLKKFLESAALNSRDFNSIAELYEFLLSNAAENGFTEEEVNALIAEYLAQKDVHVFYNELHSQVSDSLAKKLDGVDFEENGIFTSEKLLDYLFVYGKDSGFNLQELRDALYRIAVVNRDPLALMQLLESFSGPELAAVLQQMIADRKSYSDTEKVINNLFLAAQRNTFPLTELEEAVKKAAADTDMHFLSESLIFISSDSLKQTLLDLDLSTGNIHNASGLISHLLEASVLHGYAKRELLNNIEKIRTDPYYYVDLFRRLLSENASGALREFLQEIDVRNLKLNTFESLVDYLLHQSQFHDFNREMVYQLLIDIIDAKNVKEFIELISRYGDRRINGAIQATDAAQFSTPLEVVKYLLSVAEKYEYTERDILRTLLKILLRRGTSGAVENDHGGWLSGINKPAFITSLIIVNGLIIGFLIIFIIRKKRRNA